MQLTFYEMTAIVPDTNWKQPATKESKEFFSRVKNIVRGFDADYTMKYYDEWSRHYESDLVVSIQIHF